MPSPIHALTRRCLWPVLCFLLVTAASAAAMPADEPVPAGTTVDHWQAIERRIVEQVDVGIAAGNDTPDVGRGDISDHGLVRTTVLGGDYSDLPDQASDPGPAFGHSVAMDGDWLAVGAPGTLTNGAREVGALFIFRHIDAGWQLVQRVTPTGSVGTAPRCGTSVAMKLPHLLVGCPGADWPDSGAGEHGRVLFYRLSGGGDSWSLISHANFPGAGSRCGTQVAVSATGVTSGAAIAAIGCPGWNEERGRVWTRDYSAGDGAWGESWTAVNSSDNAPGDRFGESLALYRGEALGMSVRRMVVAAPHRSFPPAFGAGKVYAFEGPGWTETQSFTHVNPSSFSATFYGSALAMNASQLIIGARGGLTFVCPNAPRCGQVYRYERSGSTWQSAGGGGAVNLGGNPPGEQVGMRFGAAVAIGFDNWVAVAAPRANGWTQSNGLAQEVGMVELRRADNGGWGVSWNDHQGEVRPAGIGLLAASQGHFGTSVAFGGRRLAVGYPHAGVQIIGRRGQVWIYAEDRIFTDGFE